MFAILRTAKLKTMGNIAASLSHNYRDRETLNADESRCDLNEHSVPSAGLVRELISKSLPEKRRSDAVLAVEYLVTASPDYFKNTSDKDGKQFFETAKKWLEEKHGKENVIATSIHRDETTPHLVAYVVPIDDKGKLNCKHFLGGKSKLTQMQTDFAKAVSRHGLERGIEGSKAEHQTIKEYYTSVNQSLEKPVVSLPKAKWHETSSQFAERAQQEILDQINPKYRELSAKASQLSVAQREAQTARDAMQEQQKACKPYLDAIKGLSKDDVRVLNFHIRGEAAELKEKRQLEREEKLQVEREKFASRSNDDDRGFSR